MGTNLRSGDVKDAGASVVAYAQYCEARDAGRAEEAASDPRRHLRLQRIRLPLHAGAPELAARAGPGTRDRARRGAGAAAAAGAGSRGVRRGRAARVATPAAARSDDAALGPAELALMEFAVPGGGLPEDDRKAVAMLAAAVELPPPGAQGVLVGALRPVRERPGHASSGTGTSSSSKPPRSSRTGGKHGAKLPERRVKLTGTVSPGLGPARGQQVVPHVRAAPSGRAGGHRRATEPAAAAGSAPRSWSWARGRQGHRHHPGQAAPEHIDPMPSCRSR